MFRAVCKSLVLQKEHCLQFCFPLFCGCWPHYQSHLVTVYFVSRILSFNSHSHPECRWYCYSHFIDRNEAQKGELFQVIWLVRKWSQDVSRFFVFRVGAVQKTPPPLVFNLCAPWQKPRNRLSVKMQITEEKMGRAAVGFILFFIGNSSDFQDFSTYCQKSPDYWQEHQTQSHILKYRQKHVI